MWIQVRSMDGKKSVQIDKLSKLTTIKDLKQRIEEHFNVSSNRQRLFFGGKQLEDDHSLFDYNIGLNALVQVMFRTEQLVNLAEPKKEDKMLQEKSYDIKDKSSIPNRYVPELKKNDETPIKSHFKMNDKVDAIDPAMGAWFEAIVVDVTIEKSDEIIYHVRFEDYDENEIVKVTEREVRPRARTKLCWNQIEEGDKVMANYNPDEPRERGFWYDMTITRKAETRKGNLLYGKLTLCKDGTVSEECKIIFVDEIFKIEKTEENLYSNHTDEVVEKRKVAPDCNHCKDDPKKPCKECSCNICGGKHEPEKQIICDECDMAYHLNCMNPPLEKLPEEDEWYCHVCRNDPTEIVQAGEKLKSSKKKQKMASSITNCNRDWGKGMACVGRTQICTLVPSNHFGPIPGVPVGSAWKFRMQASEAGVHRPHVSGIHGRESEGAYSIVLAGGYEDDLDNGDEFHYTGSGGRDLSGNKRTAEQSSDQKLTKMNRALAKNCNVELNEKDGAEAVKWKSGKPVRVLRSAKFRKHSRFAPEEGIRYDGIFKVVKYWPEKGKSGFIVWRYLLRRDDPTPPPWTVEGKRLIEELGLTLQYPEGYLEANAMKNANKEKDNLKHSKKDKKSKRKRDTDNALNTESKKIKGTFLLPQSVISAAKLDTLNEKVWQGLVTGVESYKAFLDDVAEKFMCICCQELAFEAVTTTCGHNTCKGCLQRAFKAGIASCPVCRCDIGNDKDFQINSQLDTLLRQLFPGYEAGR